jgi:Transposase DDE domain group 1/Poxvirus D5 protein-like
MANPAGESKDEILKLDFDRRLMLQFRGSVVTSDAGLLAYRELDDALGLTAMAGETLADGRTGKNGRHALVGLLRQSVFGRLAGYEDFKPKCKVVPYGNHRPKLRNPEGMTRRLLMIGFEYVVPASQRDNTLKEKLQAEAPGILAWMIRGCLEWQRDGLNPPDEVKAATAEYFAKQGVVNRWLEECCERTGNQDDRETSTALYKFYKEWCKENGETSLSQNPFSQSLSENIRRDYKVFGA